MAWILPALVPGVARIPDSNFFLPQDPASFSKTLQPGSPAASSLKEQGNPSSHPSLLRRTGSLGYLNPPALSPPGKQFRLPGFFYPCKTLESGTPALCCPRAPGIWAEVGIQSSNLAGLGSQPSRGSDILIQRVLKCSPVVCGGLA